jgi:hypothetical protein
MPQALDLSSEFIGPLALCNAALRGAALMLPVPRAEGVKMMRKLVFALAAFSLVAGSAPAMASHCKDAKGKFVKCPAKPKLCRNAKGHFAKCHK